MQQASHLPRVDVLEAIRLRRSVRKYTDTPVEWDKIGTIVDAGRTAPSAGNLQSWRFIVVESHPKRRGLAEACLKQYWMEEAPVHILVVMMLKKIRDFYGKRGVELYAIQDAAMAAQNMMLAAYSVGLGSCFVSAFDEDKIVEVFNLPADIKPMGIVTLGYPAEDPEEPLKFRLENVTFMDRWGQQNVARMKDIDAILWNSRVVERGIKVGNDLVKAVDIHTRQGRKKLIEKLKEKADQMRKKMEESRKKP
ncbi:nitroreductase family protein [Candidatus Woesearchaeota archaeon]|nr:nitroreductase family protein [Candidatus Woesearchaeota archaeon]